jgi:hypothetical protein
MMVINIVIGFIIPWIVGIYLYKKNRRMVLIIFPFASVLAFLANLFGFYFEFWKMTPVLKEATLTVLPLCVGIYPVLGGYLIHMIQQKKASPIFLILIFSLFTTFLELLFVIQGRVIYDNGWNIYWTFISYLIPYGIGYGYYIALKKLKILS